MSRPAANAVDMLRESENILNQQRSQLKANESAPRSTQRCIRYINLGDSICRRSAWG
jgi:hypothetical protein